MNPFFPVSLAAGTAVYLLYRQGWAATKSIAAVLFTFRPGQNADRFVLNSCTGWVRHRIRFRKDGTYQLTLDDRLSKGSVGLRLLDRNKHTLLSLDRQFPSGAARLEAKGRYYLLWNFKQATGRCTLSWTETNMINERRT